MASTSACILAITRAQAASILTEANTVNEGADEGATDLPIEIEDDDTMKDTYMGDAASATQAEPDKVPVSITKAEPDKAPVSAASDTTALQISADEEEAPSGTSTFKPGLLDLVNASAGVFETPEQKQKQLSARKLSPSSVTKPGRDTRSHKSKEDLRDAVSSLFQKKK